MNSGGQIEYLSSQSVPERPGDLNRLVGVHTGSHRTKQHSHPDDGPDESPAGPAAGAGSSILKGWTGVETLPIVFRCLLVRVEVAGRT